MRALDRVLERLEGVQKNGADYKARCPVSGHGQGLGDRNPSLGVGVNQEGKILLNCFAGCPAEAVVNELGLKMSDLFEQDSKGGEGAFIPSKNRETVKPCTLEAYAEAKGLPIEFLKNLGLRTINYIDRPAVRMPYLNEQGSEEVCARFRVALEGKPKVKTK